MRSVIDLSDASSGGESWDSGDWVSASFDKAYNFVGINIWKNTKNPKLRRIVICVVEYLGPINFGAGVSNGVLIAKNLEPSCRPVFEAYTNQNKNGMPVFNGFGVGAKHIGRASLVVNPNGDIHVEFNSGIQGAVGYIPGGTIEFGEWNY